MGRLFLCSSSCEGDTATDLCLSSSQATESPPSSSAPLRHRKPLTIFYAGRMCVLQVTEEQAGAIIAAAQRESTAMDVKRSEAAAAEEEPWEILPLLDLQVQQQHINLELSMRRSLQRFLQNRRTRAVASRNPRLQRL